MGPKRCDCYKCENSLDSFEEVINGICEPHFKLLQNDDYYVGICWTCLKVTLVGPRRTPKGALAIKDKYIFSKGCRHCTGNESDNINWMTINRASNPTTVVTGEGNEPYTFKPITNINAIN